MAKRLVSALLAMLMILSMVSIASAEETKAFKLSDVTENAEGLTVDGDYFYVKKAMGYFGIKGVDLTGVKSIGLTGTWSGGNAEVFRIKIDDPYGDAIGFIVFNELSKDIDVTVRGNIKEVTGVHNLYFVTTLAGKDSNWRLKGVSLYNDAKPLDAPVPDSAIIDSYSDTWAATDSYGRKVADFEETGAVKDGERKVMLFYHNWHTGQDSTHARVIPEIIKKAPEARYDFAHDAWGNHMGKYYWGEPVYGFYSSNDFWVYKKQLELFASAGVDALSLDYTNGNYVFSHQLKVMLDAMCEAKAEGHNVPKFTIYGNMKNSGTDGFDQMALLYYSVYENEKYRGMWFIWEGQYFVAGYPVSGIDIPTEDRELLALRKTIDETFNYRQHGNRMNSDGYLNDISWLDNYPQPLRGVERADGRIESIAVGVAINQSTVDKGTMTGVFSDPYAKGRGFSEAFGEDYSSDNGRKAYFFREQSALALDVDPAFVMIDGWNEWNTSKYSEYNGHKVAFIDLFDEENSRDFEPSRSYIKDDYYNLLVDFIRKYKGVRPALVASEKVTIDINGDVAQWNSVAPEYISLSGDDERDSYGYLDTATNENIRYTTTINNAIMRSKVARDDANFYFYAKTIDTIKQGTEGWMNLYLNTDRNYATGWEGYDYSVNVLGEGIVAKYNGSTWENIGTAPFKVTDNVLTMSVPKSLIGETDKAEFEFKWTDSITSGDLLDFYSEGSSAPVGRFNYLYTEIPQTALTDAERAELKGTSIIKAGAKKMIVSGGKMPIYEADTRITAFESNGTLYVPFKTYEEILGYGLSKVKYDYEQNIVRLSRHDLSEDYKEITNKEWTYSVIGTFEARNNGFVKTLTAPVTVVDGIIYVPVSYLSDVFGWNVKNFGNGLYAVSKTAINEETVTAVSYHIG